MERQDKYIDRHLTQKTNVKTKYKVQFKVVFSSSSQTFRDLILTSNEWAGTKLFLALHRESADCSCIQTLHRR